MLVGDLERARAYFESLFAIECRPHPTDPRTLMVESPGVHFFLREMAAPPEFLAGQHLSFEVPALDAVLDMLAARGIPHETGRFDHFRHRNYRWAEWRGPDGIRLECVERDR